MTRTEEYGSLGLCVRCGQAESERHHKHTTSLPEGWHPFRGQAYVDALEDALLFIRENNAVHSWRVTGVTVDTLPPFPEKVCTNCGAINWGGKESGVCFGQAGKAGAESALTAAHNRRACRLYEERVR